MTWIHPAFAPPCHDDESPASFCSRMALLAGRTARDFCNDVGLRFQRVVDGEPAELDALARLGHLPGRFPGLVVSGSGHLFELNGESLTRETLSRKNLRVCPQCVQEDLRTGCGHMEARPYGRTIWLVDPLKTCMRHLCPLVVASKDERPNFLHDFAGLVATVLPSILEAEPSTRKASGLETYVLDRLQGRASRDWLAPIPLHAVSRMGEIIGCVETIGRRFRMESLSESDLHEAGAVGFDILVGGEDSFRSFLERLQSRFKATRTTWGPKATFGRLYEMLAHECVDPAYDPFRDLIAQHVLETMPVGPEDRIFGRAIESRRLHSIHSASLEYGVHPTRLRKLALSSGLIDGTTDALSNDRILVEADRMERFLEDVAQSMSLKEAGAYLGAPRPIDMQLLKSGMIEPWIRGARDALGDHAFRRSDLDRFLGRLLVPKGDPAGHVLHGVGEAARRANCFVLEIFNLLLEGRLTTVALDPHRHGCESLLVDVEEIRPLVRLPDHGGVSMRNAENLLRVSTVTMKALVGAGHLPTRRARNPVNRCLQTVVSEKDIEEFGVRYVSLVILSRETGIHHLRLKKMLAERRIEPAFADIPMHFYERKRVSDFSPE